MNRGVEIAGEVADSTRSLVTEQVANGVAVRMAVLWSLLGSGGPVCLSVVRSCSYAAGACSTRPASAPPTCASSTAGSPRSAPALSAGAGATVLDAEGCVVTPGLVDIQVHFREPGREDAETIETGARRGRARRLHRGRLHAEHRAAARRRRGRAVGARAGPRGPRATCASPVASPRAARAWSSRRWGSSTTSACACSPTTATASPTRSVMRRAFEYASRAAGRGARAARRGSRARARRSHARRRVVGAARHPRPARGSGVVDRRPRPRARAADRRPLPRAAPVEPRSRPQLVRAAKADGVRVTAECTPQHLVLTDERCAGFDPVFKMNPPLREQADVDALRAALLDGTIDAIATDHAPHAPETKDVAVRGGAARHARRRDRARGRAHDARRAGRAHARAGVRARCRGSRRASPASTPTGTAARSRPGAPAHLCVIDPDEAWVVDAQPAREPLGELAVGRLEAHRQGPPHDLDGTPTVRDSEPTR